MDINLVKAVTPVSPSLVSTSNRTSSAAVAPTGDVVALPVLGDGGASTAAVPGVAAAQPAQAEPQRQPVQGFDPKAQLEAVAKQLQEYLQSSQRDVEFRVDADTHAQVVTVRDSATGEVIRQMPSEEVLRVMRNLYAAQGSLFDAKA